MRYDFFFHPRYDVELYQRIEQLIGKKLPLHATVEEEVMSLMERVSEAQRHAKMVRKYTSQSQRSKDMLSYKIASFSDPHSISTILILK